jgi:N-acetylglutamate synthase-like GNAT family acetyltransferase
MMEIRKAKKGDLKEIAEIFRVETAKEPYLMNWNEKTSLMKIKELFEIGEIFILEEKKIIGFIAIQIRLGSKGKKAIVDELWIKQDFQGKGFGKSLINFLENYLKKKNIFRIAVISDKNSKAYGFYEKLNFKAYPEDILMAKKIDEN